MADLLFIVIAAIFFAICIAYVRGLDRIVRQGDEPAAGSEKETV
jgi:hypothetical protein